MFKRIVCLVVLVIMCFGVFGCTRKEDDMADYISVEIKEEYYEDFLLEQLDFGLDKSMIIYNINGAFRTEFSVDVLLKDGVAKKQKRSTKKIMRHLEKLDFIEYGRRHMYSLDKVSIHIKEEYVEDLLAGKITINDIGLDNGKEFNYYAAYQNLSYFHADLSLKKRGRSEVVEAINHLNTLDFVADAFIQSYGLNMGWGYPGDWLELDKSN